MSPSSEDTIFALSSGRPPAAIAVIRISGPQARNAVAALAKRIPEPRRATLARLHDPASGDLIDESLVLFFPGPNSETGEDTAELQIHGGRAVVAAVVKVLGRLPGCRMAEPGEFTRRAFEHARIDLTQVEALADLIGAETEAQRRQALRHMHGLLGGRAESWRARIIEALALMEAQIDFADESDVPEDLTSPALTVVQGLLNDIETALADRRGERIRDGLVVAIAGAPNAGKSSLLNRIARREAAIVSPIPGTTRDAIEVHLDLQGYPMTLVDTAGIRESDDPIEQEGVRRARQRAESADLVLWMEDSSAPSEGGPSVSVSDADRRLSTPVWAILNKSDLISKDQKLDSRSWMSKHTTYRLSAMTGAGLDQLEFALAEFAAAVVGAGETALVTRERHRHALGETATALRRALAESGGSEIIAEELRLASRALGRLTGRIDVEDILDVIFRDFCIGK